MANKNALLTPVLYLLVSCLFLGFLTYQNYATLASYAAGPLQSQYAKTILLQPEDFSAVFDRLAAGEASLSFSSYIYTKNGSDYHAIHKNSGANAFDRALVTSLAAEGGLFADGCAAVGKTVLAGDEAVSYNGETYILEFEGRQYAVNGVFADTLTHMLDHTVFLPLERDQQRVFTLVVDGRNQKVVDGAIEALQLEFAVEEIIQGDHFLDRFFFASETVFACLALLLLFLLLAGLFLVVAVVRAYKQEYRIKVIIGVPCRQIAGELFRGIVCRAGVSSLAALLLYGGLYAGWLRGMGLCFYVWEFLLFSAGVTLLLFAATAGAAAHYALSPNREVK